MATFQDFGIDIRGRTGEVKCTCPKCSATRKKKNALCLDANTDKGVWQCHHCGWAGTIKSGEDRQWMKMQEKVYIRPKQPPMKVDLPWLEWLEKRGISKKVIERNLVGSGPMWMPQTEQEEDCIMFPFFRGRDVVNVKYRDRNKNFRLATGAERILYGLDDIDPEELIWVEGEVDKLSIEEAGAISCVSVPDGAPSVASKDYASKFTFIDSAAEILTKVKRHILAVDTDPPGQKLQEELIRRLGAEKCWVVEWPAGCKDANEVLIRHGGEKIRECLDNARPAPVAGIVQVADVFTGLMARYENGVPPGRSTGWGNVDQFYTVREGEWSLVTGIPGHGKSEWLDALMVNLSRIYGWKHCVFSPENQPLEAHVEKITEKVIGKPFSVGPTPRMSSGEVNDAATWINHHFTFLCPEETPSVEEILGMAKIAIRRNGISGLVIDPWNEIDHKRPKELTETEYISKSLSQIRRFARENRVHIWVVAHPTKMRKDEKTKEYPVPTPYDVSGSAHWRNKADNCIAIYRNVGSVSATVQVHIQKIRFKSVGRVGCTELKYNRITGQYAQEGE